MARKDKDADRAYIREYMREQRAWYREHERCADCGKKDAYTMAGRYRCYECAWRKHERDTGHRDRVEENERARDLRAERREKGLCTKCGAKLPDGYEYVMCGSCRARDRARQEKKRRDAGTIPRAENFAYGLCYICGSPVAKGEALYSGRPLRLCVRCHKNTIKAGQKGRDAYLEKYGRTRGQMRYQYEHGREAAKGTGIRGGIHAGYDSAADV